MIDASSETTHSDFVEPAEHLGSGIVLLWLVMGSALVATAIVAFGWRWTIAIWVASGIVLGMIGAAERFWHRHRDEPVPPNE